MEVIIRAVFGITDPDRVAELKRVLPRLSSLNPILLLSAAQGPGPAQPVGPLRPRPRPGRPAALRRDRAAPRDVDGASEDILALLLAARDEHGDPLTDRELRDELITLLLAGHETTATSIGWAFERLLRTPHALARLTAEVRAGRVPTTSTR